MISAEAVDQYHEGFSGNVTAECCTKTSLTQYRSAKSFGTTTMEQQTSLSLSKKN